MLHNSRPRRNLEQVSQSFSKTRILQHSTILFNGFYRKLSSFDLLHARSDKLSTNLTLSCNLFFWK